MLNLFAMAAADGTFEKSELDLIFKIGVDAGLTSDELNRIMARPESITFNPPDTYRERIEQLYDLVLVMLIDGKIHDRESALCRIFAVKLGFQPIIIDNIICDIIDYITDGIAVDVAFSKLLKYA